MNATSKTNAPAWHDGISKTVFPYVDPTTDETITYIGRWEDVPVEDFDLFSSTYYESIFMRIIDSKLSLAELLEGVKSAGDKYVDQAIIIMILRWSLRHNNTLRITSEAELQNGMAETKFNVIISKIASLVLAMI